MNKKEISGCQKLSCTICRLYKKETCPKTLGHLSKSKKKCLLFKLNSKHFKNFDFRIEDGYIYYTKNSI